MTPIALPPPAPLTARERARLAANNRTRPFRRRAEAFWADFRAFTLLTRPQIRAHRDSIAQIAARKRAHLSGLQSPVRPTRRGLAQRVAAVLAAAPEPLGPTAISRQLLALAQDRGSLTALRKAVSHALQAHPGRFRRAGRTRQSGYYLRGAGA